MEIQPQRREGALWLRNDMGRVKYSDEERNQIMMKFLTCAREMIDTEGMESVSIRKVSQRAGFNSATLYLYFKDVDELITLASMGYLESYCRDLGQDMALMQTPRDVYFHTWKIFCRHAFQRPKVFYHLFFHPHAFSMDNEVNRYYEIYPDVLGDFDGVLREMLQQGKLSDRNMKALVPVAAEYGLTEQQVTLVNDLTVCYFKKLLEETKRPNGDCDVEPLVQKMLQAIEFLFLTGKR